jgi:hypothetical protein
MAYGSVFSSVSVVHNLEVGSPPFCRLPGIICNCSLRGLQKVLARLLCLDIRFGICSIQELQLLCGAFFFV